MNEKQLQHELVVWFSQQYPQYRGLLFEVNNDTYNMKHAMKRRSMGMIRGASDLVLAMPIFGRIIAIELKAPGSTHEKEHIQNQIEWGEIIIKNGGFYLITSDLEIAKKFIKIACLGNFEQLDTIQWISINIVKSKFNNKTVRFI